MNCSSLTSITLPQNLTTISYNMFFNSGLESIIIPNGVTKIEQFAFYGCSTLTSIVIPDKVTLIDEFAFCECSSLTSIVIPASVSYVGFGVFEDCSCLESVYCLAVNPPVFDDVNYRSFNNNASGRKIYVPRESVEAYKSADGWCDYADDIEGYDFE